MENKKILIIEDDKNYSWLLRENFDKEKFSVVYALDGEEGLEVVEKEKPDLILLDILLPKMDGLEVAKKLKEKGDKTPIIFLTNFKDADHMTRAVEITGETQYVIKADMHIQQIVDMVRERLEKISG